VLTLDPIVQARRPLLVDLAGVDDEIVAALSTDGIYSPEQLVRAQEAGELSLDVPYAHANLSLHKGMGTAMAAALQERGIDDIPALGSADPEVLWKRLQDVENPPRLAQVKVWVRAASINGRRRR
jgi:hypothetical protein